MVIIEIDAYNITELLKFQKEWDDEHPFLLIKTNEENITDFLSLNYNILFINKEVLKFFKENNEHYSRIKIEFMSDLPKDKLYFSTDQQFKKDMFEVGFGEFTLFEVLENT